MRLLVVGATGGTGLEIVRQALQRGHSVTAFVRSTERLQPFRDRITVKQGNLLNGSELEGRAFLAWWRADSRRRQSGNVNEARR